MLDPFGGTCSILAAAHYLKLKGIAYEKYPKIEVIKDRILNSQFSPQKQILIPDMEKVIHYFNELFNKLVEFYPNIDLKKLDKAKFSAKKLEQIISTLNDFELDNDFLITFFNVKTREKQKSRKLEAFVK